MGTSCPPPSAIATTRQHHPPSATPRLSSSSIIIPCASSLHPAFFTDRLRRTPVSFSSGTATAESPVTLGYAYQESERRKQKL